MDVSPRKLAFTMNTQTYDPNAVDELARSVVKAFDDGDVEVLAGLVHPGQDERDRGNSEKWERLLMKANFKVVSWEASPWKQPDWEVFGYMRFHPDPVAMIEMKLEDPEKHTNDFFVACAPLDGRYMQCYYVDK